MVSALWYVSIILFIPSIVGSSFFLADDLMSSKRKKKSQDNGGGTCRIESNVDDFLEDDEEGSHEPASAAAAAAAPDVRARTRTAVANVTVGDADALDCGVCFLALRPPIFQVPRPHIAISISLAFLETQKESQIPD